MSRRSPVCRGEPSTASARWLSHPGEFAYIGAFSGGLFSYPSVDVQAVNQGTKLARLYSGDVDFAYALTKSTMQWLTSQGIKLRVRRHLGRTAWLRHLDGGSDRLRAAAFRT